MLPSSVLSRWLSQDVSRAKLAAIIPDPVVAPSIVPVLKDEVDRKPEYPKPDTQQMIPFQPRHLARKSDVPSEVVALTWQRVVINLCLAKLVTEHFLVFSHLHLYLHFRLLFNRIAKGVCILPKTKVPWK